MKPIAEPAAAPAVMVLRDVVMTAQPHALARPARPGAMPAQQPRSNPGKGPDVQQAYQEGLAQGLAEGLAEGLKQGRAQALADGVNANQDALQAAIESARRAAQEQGMQEGLKRSAQIAQEQAREVREAADAALEEAMREVNERCARLDKILSTCLTERARILANAEDDMVLIVHEAICKVLGSEAAKPQTLSLMVKQLIAQHGLHEALSVHLHPMDVEAIRMDRAVDSADTWQCVPDASVAVGGVVLRSADGSVDARLETQMQSLGEMLLAVRRERQAQAVQTTRDGS